MLEIINLLKQASAMQASDLHLSVGVRPFIRVDGKLEALNLPIMHQNKFEQIMAELLDIEYINSLKQQKEIDLTIEVEAMRCRINIFWQYRGGAASFRFIPKQVPSLDQLKLPKIIKEFCSYENGLILVTGPTGSGKTTTLAAMVDHINQIYFKHIITLEDPIEFLHAGKNCLINQRQLGSHTSDALTALRAALREDPDIILIGEIRDLETMRLALTAAETGHLVLASLHTYSAPKTIERIISMFSAAEKDYIKNILSEILRVVIMQKLFACNNGGRTAACEIMINNAAIQNLIRENKISQIYTIMQTGKAQGMCTLEQSIANLTQAKHIK